MCAALLLCASAALAAACLQGPSYGAIARRPPSKCRRGFQQRTGKRQRCQTLQGRLSLCVSGCCELLSSSLYPPLGPATQPTEVYMRRKVKTNVHIISLVLALAQKGVSGHSRCLTRGACRHTEGEAHTGTFASFKVWNCSLEPSFFLTWAATVSAVARPLLSA